MRRQVMVDAYRASPAKPLSLTAVRRVVAGDIGGVRPAASRALHGCYDALGVFRTTLPEQITIFL